MARKYMRLKRDGSVYNWNGIISLDSDYDEFESIDPPPEVIVDLLAYRESQLKKLKERSARKAASPNDLAEKLREAEE